MGYGHKVRDNHDCRLEPFLSPPIKALYMFIRFPAGNQEHCYNTEKQKLATNPEYNSTCSFGREEKTTMPPIIAPIPNNHDTSTLSNSFILCLIHNATMPTRVDINVARSIGKKTSVGLDAPACARYINYAYRDKTKTRRIEHQEHNHSISGRVLLGVEILKLLHRLKSQGVAALSRPNIFADTFMNIDPIAGCPLGTPGNRRQNNGLTRRPKNE